MRILSRKQIDRLGDRLRREGSPSTDDVGLLATYRDEHLPVLAKVLHMICGLGLQHSVCSARQKNAQTIVEKLRRERDMEFSNMQDIAGARIVLLKGGRDAQDAAVGAICSAFPDHKKVIDRRAKPVAGYRAVHVPVKQDGYLAEIQVRTDYQDRWAQLFERLGDHLGRQIRYGEAPDEPQRPVRDGSPVTRAEFVDHIILLAAQIADLEELEQAVVRAEEKWNARLKDAPVDLKDAREEVKRGTAELRQKLADLFRDTGAVLKALQEVVPETPTTPVQITPAVTVGQPFPHFLVAYRRSTGTLIECTGFDDRDIEKVVARRTELEQQHSGDPDYEVVLLASHSEADLLKTHARYFRNLAELASPKVSKVK